jgi:hypothetical protein
MLTVGIAVGILAGLDTIADSSGYVAAAAAGAVILVLAGAVAAFSSVAAKWLLVGRISAGDPFACFLRAQIASFRSVGACCALAAVVGVSLRRCS